MGNSAEERLLLPLEATNIDLKSEVWEELKMIWRIEFPAMVAKASSLGMIIMTLLFFGHISELDLAAYALEQTIFLRFVIGILLGMSSATKVLCGQAYGVGQYHMLGIYLQRSWLVNGATATICIPLFIFTKQILIAIGQDMAIAEEAGVVSLWFIGFIYNFVFNLSIQQFLQAQMNNKINGFIAAPVLVFHVLLTALLVLKLGLGVPGAMGSLILSGWLNVIGQLVYLFGGWCHDTWTGFTKATLVDLWPVLKLSASSGSLGIWYNSIPVLMAGYMKNATVEIDAFSTCLNINAWQYMICFGFVAAASVRISNEPGRGNVEAAKFAMKVIISNIDKQIAQLFTSDDEIAEAITNLPVLLAFSMLLNSIQSVLNGIAIGSGMQSLIAYVNLGCYYLVGIPLGACLGYLTNLELTGLWIGLLTGVVLQTLFLNCNGQPEIIVLPVHGHGRTAMAIVAAETLCAQALGARQYHMLGIYMQLSWLVNLATMTICFPLFIFTKQIMIAIGRDKSIAELEAGIVSLSFIPYIYSAVFMLSIQQLLQTQMRNRIVGFITAPVFVCLVLLSALLVLKLGLGLTGAMISLTLAGWAVFGGEIVDVFSGCCRDTWTGFGTAAFVDHWPVVKPPASSGVMLWYFSISIWNPINVCGSKLFSSLFRCMT